ncbi:MAG: hypothetical protein ACREBW_03765 [Candidatus Micrarchaeaceae archaeon]
MLENLNGQYRDLKSVASQELGGDAVCHLITEMALQARRMLTQTKRIQLASRVVAKRYFCFTGAESSRPINESIYVADEDEFNRLLRLFQEGFRGARPEQIVASTYTIAYGVLAANDVHAVGRKASATFFEILVGHIVSRAVGVSPRKKVKNPETGADLPTDYVFDPGPQGRKIHLPIKTSTRERAVQAWVHQRVLDGIFGAGHFRGLFVVGSETKCNSKTGEVTEICVPQQLQMFQSRVSEISRIYYLDPPRAYLALTASFPRVEVRSFGEILNELPELLRN